MNGAHELQVSLAQMLIVPLNKQLGCSIVKNNLFTMSERPEFG